MSAARLRTRILAAIKIAVAAGLLVYLIVQAQRHERFAQLVSGKKDWTLLATALVLVLAAASTTFLRWYLLVRSLGLPFRVRDAFRLGSLGFLMNFVALGSVGGDLFKAVLVAKEQPGRRTEAIATVVIDRLVGLYALLIVASVAILAWDLGGKVGGTPVAILCDVTLMLTLLGAIGFCLLLIPGFTGGRVTSRLARVPLAGETLVRLVAAVRVYRAKLPVVFNALLASVGVHTLLVLAIYAIATGLPGPAPSLQEHFLVVPLSMVAGAIPVTPNGLGTFEAALDYLYRVVGSDAGIETGRGTVIALCYRLTTIVVAAVGAVYYISERRAVAAAMDEIEGEIDGETEGKVEGEVEGE